MAEEKRVKMYTLSTCGYCKAAKKFMNDNGIEYDFVDVDLLEMEEKRAVLREAREIADMDRISFPMIVIDGDTVIVGFKEYEIRNALGL